MHHCHPPFETDFMDFVGLAVESAVFHRLLFSFRFGHMCIAKWESKEVSKKINYSIPKWWKLLHGHNKWFEEGRKTEEKSLRHFKKTVSDGTDVNSCWKSFHCMWRTTINDDEAEWRCWQALILNNWSLFVWHFCYSVNYILSYGVVVPGAPTGLHAEVSQSQTNSAHTVNVRLSWKPPLHVNGIIQSYNISLTTNSNLPDPLWTNIVSNGMFLSVPMVVLCCMVIVIQLCFLLTFYMCFSQRLRIRNCLKLYNII